MSEKSIGIDFGCRTQLSFSNDIKIKFQVKISKRIKRLDRKIMKNKRKDSKNKRKDQAKRRKVYEKLTNKKTDIRHKIVNAIKSNFKYVIFQDENIKGWQRTGHGKKIQTTAIGKILSDLKNKSLVPIEVDRFFPSTKLCLQCNNKYTIDRDAEIYNCPSCGFIMDRDSKAAICIENEGWKQLPTDRRKVCESTKLGETSPSTFFNTLKMIHGIEVSK